MWLALLSAVAFAAEPTADPAVDVVVGGHVKSFVIASFPYDSVLLPDTATAQTAIDTRLTGKLTAGIVTVEVHPALTAVAGGGVSGFGTGVGVNAPELFPFSAELGDPADDLSGRLRLDRAVVEFTPAGVSVALGRQAISFGQGKVFTPLDLVNPFTPTTIDTEYKPGVDAARVDWFKGMTQVTLVGAYLGDDTLDGTGLALHAQTTIITADVALMAALMYSEPVVGTSFWIPVGPVGAYGDAAVTVTEDRPEVRAVIGADARPTATTMLNVELHAQTFGTTDPGEYFLQYLGDRY